MVVVVFVYVIEPVFTRMSINVLAFACVGVVVFLLLVISYVLVAVCVCMGYSCWGLCGCLCLWQCFENAVIFARMYLYLPF